MKQEYKQIIKSIGINNIMALKMAFPAFYKEIAMLLNFGLTASNIIEMLKFQLNKFAQIK